MAAMDVTVRSRERWAPEQIALIRSTVANGATAEQTALFLEVAAKYDLDPFLREVWCAVPMRQGVPDTSKVLIMVGRDGFLKVAQRSGEFGGIAGDVVYAGDDFRVTRRNGATEVEHSYGADRGRDVPIGAWALVWRTTVEHPFYFFAPWEQYVPANASSYSPWTKQRNAMILKVAEVNALRRAFGITGIYEPGEVGLSEDDIGSMPRVGDVEVTRAAAAERPPQVAEALAQAEYLMDQANAVRAGAWMPGKRRMLFDSAIEPSLALKVVEQAAAWFVERGLDVPEWPPRDVASEPSGEESPEAGAESSEEDVDGEVVPTAWRGEGFEEDGEDDGDYSGEEIPFGEPAAAPVAEEQASEPVAEAPADDAVPGETPWERKRRKLAEEDPQKPLGEELG